MPENTQRLLGESRFPVRGQKSGEQTSAIHATDIRNENKGKPRGNKPDQFPVTECIHELFQSRASRLADRVALQLEDQVMNYGELNARANQLAHYLRSKGVGGETLVGLCTERTFDLVVGILGILKAGAAFVPLEPSLPADRLAWMIQDTRMPIVITHESARHRFADQTVDEICIDKCRDHIAQQSSENPISDHTSADSLAYVIYTSGSTGQPKGVLATHANVVRLFQATDAWFQFDRSDVWTLFHSFAFDFSVWEIWGALLYGGRLVIVPTDVSRSPGEFRQLVARAGVTVLNQTPSAFRQFIDADAKCRPELALRYVILGGEKLSFEALIPWFERHGDQRPRLINMYGITETTVHVTYHPIQASECRAGKSLVGRPIPDLQVYILDESLNPVPVNVPGEICVAGAGVARGYLNRPELTNERFVPHPFGGTTRLYRSGDFARFRSNGEIEYLGRQDQQVKIRGFRIELGEIESALVRHVAVRDAVLLERTDTFGHNRLVAYVIPKTMSVPTIHDLRDHLRQQLPEYMLPAAFVFLEALPLTVNGKLDRALLPSPDRVRPELEVEYVAPRTPPEQRIAGICAELLGLDDIGINDNLFELGAHSLLMMMIASRVREAFHVEPPLQCLLESPTVAELAHTVEQLQVDRQTSYGEGIRPARRNGDLPVSFSQERAWFIQQLNPGSRAYNSQSVLRFQGPLDAVALERSLTEIVRRHEIFRTTFPTVDGRPVQVVHEPAPVVLPVFDIEPLPDEEKECEIQRLTDRMLAEPFELNRLPLVRWQLVRHGGNVHTLIHVEHHLVHDGWSFNVFLDELQQLYRAYSRGDDSPLSYLPIQFADFAIWQREWMTGAVARNQLEYWKQKLAGSPPAIGLTLDRPRPAVQTYRGAAPRFEISTQLHASLKELSRNEGVTLYMIMFAAFATLLHRYCEQTDLCIGVGVANRRRRETERLIGMIINTVVLRADLAENPTVRELLQRVRRTASEAYENQDVPFDKVVEALHPRRDPSRNPLFQVAFSFHDSPISRLNFPDLDVDLTEAVSNQSAKFDLNIIVIPRAEQQPGSRWIEDEKSTTVIWEYNSDLFDQSTISRMIAHYQAILYEFASVPSTRISNLRLLDEAEHQQTLTWAGTTIGFPRESTIVELFERQASQTPEAVAVAFGHQELTYAELNSRANQLAWRLHDLGVGPEVMVGICTRRSLEMVVGILGILKAGGAYVPLDPDYPRQRLAFMIQDTQSPVLLTQHNLADKLPKHAAKLICLDSDWPDIATHSVENPASNVTADNLAYVIYTSGSTGLPKGTSIVHRSVVRLVKGTNYVSLGPNEVMLQFAPISFDASTFELWGSLLNGGKLVVFPPPTPSLEELGRTIREQRITTLWLTAALFHQMVDHQLESLCGVRQLLAGGDVLSVPHVRQILKRLGPEQRLINGYGPTENTTFTCCHVMDSATPIARSVPIGRPITGTQVYILDAHQQPVPIGVPGELFIGGDGLARQYLNRPDLTAEKFVANPFSPAPNSRLYKTGDRCRWSSDGTIEFLGRQDHQVKVRGFRVELGEIEAALMDHPAVLEAATLLRQNDDGDSRIVAYSVAKGGIELEPSDIDEFLRQTLPAYMLPSAYLTLDSLPLSPNGKLDRESLPEPPIGRLAKGSPVAARSETEERIAEIWQEILKIDTIGTHDNFFELGGHSLLATRIISRLRAAFGRQITFTSLFDNPTIAGLAKIIGKAS